jgi:hypothetical protein
MIAIKLYKLKLVKKFRSLFGIGHYLTICTGQLVEFLGLRLPEFWTMSYRFFFLLTYDVERNEPQRVLWSIFHGCSSQGHKWIKIYLRSHDLDASYWCIRVYFATLISYAKKKWLVISWYVESSHSKSLKTRLCFYIDAQKWPFFGIK